MTTWVALLASVSLEGLRPRIRPVWCAGWLRFDVLVVDRERGGAEEWQSTVWIPVGWWVEARAGLDWLRRTLKAQLAHEVDEHLLVHGQRVFDPHGGN